MVKKPANAPATQIEEQILLLRGHRVMLDYTLAELYCVEVRTLNQAVRRNIDRFPQDFMIRLTAEEMKSLRSQFVILKPGKLSRRSTTPSSKSFSTPFGN